MATGLGVLFGTVRHAPTDGDYAVIGNFAPIWFPTNLARVLPGDGFPLSKSLCYHLVERPYKKAGAVLQHARRTRAGTGGFFVFTRSFFGARHR